MERPTILIVTAVLGGVQEMANQGIELLTQVDPADKVLRHIGQMRTLLVTAEQQIKRSARVAKGSYESDD